MKLNNIVFILLCLSLGIFSSHAKDQIKVACIGNSITGFHQFNFYATPLQELLGDDYLVDNFGKGGSGIFREMRESVSAEEAKWAYLNSSECADALAWNPDIIVVKFGANDCNKSNFDKYGVETFKSDYKDLLNKFTSKNPDVRIILCTPPPLFYDRNGIWGSYAGPVNVEIIQPAVKELAAELGVTLVDLHAPLENHPEYFADKIHPDHRGHFVIAQEVYAGITGERYVHVPAAGEFVPVEGQQYYLENQARGYVLEIQDRRDSKGSIDGSPCALRALEEENEKQLFTIEPFSYKINFIRSVSSNKYIRAQKTITIDETGGSDYNPFGGAADQFAFYIEPEQEHHTIRLSSDSYLGLRHWVFKNTPSGAKTKDELSEIDLWRFVPAGGSSIKEVKLTDNKSSIYLADGVVYIKDFEDAKTIKAYNIQGQLVYQDEINDKQARVNLPGGLYIISVESPLGKQSIKAIIP